MSTPHKLSLSVQYAVSAHELPTRPKFRRWIKAALQRDVQITLRIVDEIEGRELNKNYRGKDYATNVLTFVYDDEEMPLDLTDEATDSTSIKQIALSPLYGDIVICAPVVDREALEQKLTLDAHYAHLAIHAALHLQGYDHENEKDAAAMESLETAIMLKIGYADPYQAVIM